jgi:pyrroline-5-carboxylate reductase
LRRAAGGDTFCTMKAEPAGGPAAGTIVLVGCGQMGGAMLHGWLARGAAARFLVVEPAGPAAGLADAAAISWHRAAADLPEDAAPAAIVFAVKPQVIDDVLPPYRPVAGPHTLFLSIAAGTTIARLARHLGAEAAIVRAMPNTPAAIGRAITVACPNTRVDDGQRRLCEGLLAAIGESAWVAEEALMDAVTALSGSGPAYVFLMIEALAAAGERVGLSAELALRLACATVAGSGELALRSDRSPARLREAVTSPGGTTRAALDVLMADPGGLPQLIERAVAAATRRSRELAG